VSTKKAGCIVQSIRGETYALNLYHAPSVGLMQPWKFIVIEENSLRQIIHEIFKDANSKASSLYNEEQRSLYNSLKLEGILQAPVNICVTCDPTTTRGYGLGRQTMPETSLYSTVCAIQNLWLAARAEGIGMGWVSILDVNKLRTILEIPNHVIPVAYLCLGYVTEFGSKPELEEKNWEQRVPLSNTIYFNRFGICDNKRTSDMVQALSGNSLFGVYQ
jgi:5,6-dimethylbenzimidazole synthase